MHKGGSRENSQETTYRKCGNRRWWLDPEGDGGKDEKWSNSGYVSNSGADRICLETGCGCKRKRGLEADSNIFGFQVRQTLTLV